MKYIPLPEPVFNSSFSIEKALLKRRSIREFSPYPLSIEEISQLLWAAQGVTHFEGFRTAPSAGALYPLEIYVVIGNVKNLKQGIYKYNPYHHELILVKSGDYKNELYQAALGQEWVKNGVVCFVITGVYDRTTRKYGSRGIRYVDMEAGHAAQNLLLQATALNIGCVTVGAFYDNQIRQILEIDIDEFPLYLIPAGKI
ncbi:SagB-type dehydrogenase domain-containing protein [Persephonella hydrogeniphila]|uniref:SagB-type dehydrogenase domain-containing protein n=1 Tax=Persephonella hydrogeniphila TaxID=198703 RepID=A0A285N9F1_9AQUI|nr:SagB/ThcOx family dehydrogenase [Persephonella hydrogeniphila]SNZ06112.1 SagB-type dehydrogenase domain-containing protein [Persephonella hydrogeniphila]